MIIMDLFKCLGKLSFKSLNKVEIMFIFLIVWICLFSLQYEHQSMRSFYSDSKSHDDLLSALKNNQKKSDEIEQKVKPLLPTQGGKGDKPGHKSLPVTGKPKPAAPEKPKPAAQEKPKTPIPQVKITIDVMKWFQSRPEVHPFKIEKKHPYLRKYSVPKNICNNGPVHLLIYLHTRSKGWLHRDALRTTWASRNNFREIKVERIFIISSKEMEEDDELAYELENEISKNDDMVIVDEVDKFQFLSYKAIAMLDLVNSRCKQAKYILKADDDFFVNPYLIVENLVSRIWNKTHAVMCHVKEDLEAIQDKENRWYIPKDSLPNKNSTKLPTFCSGYTVLFTSDLIPLMYEKSFSQPYVQVDDAYLFGLLLSDVKDVTFINIMNQMTLNNGLGFKDYMDTNKKLERISVSCGDIECLNKLWKITLSRLSPFGIHIANPGFVPH